MTSSNFLNLIPHTYTHTHKFLSFYYSAFCSHKPALYQFRTLISRVFICFNVHSRYFRHTTSDTRSPYISMDVHTIPTLSWSKYIKKNIFDALLVCILQQ